MEELKQLNKSQGFINLYNIVTTISIHDIHEKFNANKFNAATSFRLLPFSTVKSLLGGTDINYENFMEYINSTTQSKNISEIFYAIDKFIKSLLKESDVDKQYKNIKKYGIGVENPSKKLIEKLKIKYPDLFVYSSDDKIVYDFYFMYMKDFIAFKMLRYYSCNDKIECDKSDKSDKIEIKFERFNSGFDLPNRKEQVLFFSKYKPKDLEKLLKTFNTNLENVTKTMKKDKTDFFNKNGRNLGGDDSHKNFAEWIVVRNKTDDYLADPLGSTAKKLYKQFTDEGSPDSISFVLMYFAPDGTIEWDDLEDEFDDDSEFIETVRLNQNQKKKSNKKDLLNLEIENKENEFLKYYKKHKNFDNFLRYINSRIYLYDAKRSSRYTIKDISEIKIKDMFKDEILINVEVFLMYLYNEYLNISKTQNEIDTLISKYNTWNYVLIERIYKKHIDENFNVKNINDLNLENITFVGGY